MALPMLQLELEFQKDECNPLMFILKYVEYCILMELFTQHRNHLRRTNPGRS